MTTATPQPVPLTDADADPFRYGWRLVPRPTPDNPHHFEQVPLTLDDVLHPEVGDFIVHSDLHETDRMYLTAVLRARLEPSRRAIVLSDVRIAWDLPDLRAHGPDVMVIPGVRKRRNWSTFEVAVERARPALIIEIVSPDARENDVVIKVEQYARSGVAQYVIVDDTGRGGCGCSTIVWKVQRTGCRNWTRRGGCTWRLPTYGWGYGATTWSAMTRRGGKLGTM